VQGIQAGARAYITKPFKLEELRQKVAKVLG
jgi:DNA-binding response OmpR family regulator